MGYYIDPPDCTKEEFLQKHGRPVAPSTIVWEKLPIDLRPVCLVDNSCFTAAGIAFSKGELNVFRYARDPRPKKWFLVHTTKLIEVCPEVEHVL